MIAADGSSISSPAGRSRHRDERADAKPRTLGDTPSECLDASECLLREGPAANTRTKALAVASAVVDPDHQPEPDEPDLDAIAADLAAVETALADLEAGTYA